MMQDDQQGIAQPAQDHHILRVLRDAASPCEMQAILHKIGAGTDQRHRVRRALKRLERKGLVKYEGQGIGWMLTTNAPGAEA